MGGVIVEEDQKQKLDIFISIVYGRMWLFKPYTYDPWDFCNTDLVSNIYDSLDLFANYDNKVAYQISEN